MKNGKPQAIIIDKLDYSVYFKQDNFQERPELSRVGVAGQGVPLVEPYNAEI